MNSNIVVFGPANVGKSTIIGYLVSKLDSSFNLERFISKIKNESWYKDEEKFRFISDRGRLERERQFDNQGQTRFMHVIRVNSQKSELSIIDTPGAEHAEKQRIKGMAFGEIGIFVIEVKQFLECDAGEYDSLLKLYSLLNPLYFWLKLKGPKNLIFAFSKVDLIEFSFEEFDKARKNLRSLCKDPEIDPIPISIDRISESDMNVIFKHELTSWYNGPTLKELIEAKLQNLNISDKEDDILTCKIDKVFNVIGKGKIYRTKILSGSLSLNAIVKFGPIFLKNEWVPFLKAQIQSIHLTTKGEVDFAVKGEIVGLQIRFINKYLDRDVIQHSKASLICNEKQVLAIGNSFRFKIPINELNKVKFNNLIVVVFFGKLLMCKILKIIKTEENFISIIVCVDSEYDNKLILPMQDGTFIFTEFLMRNQKSEFFTGELENFGFIKEMNFNFGKEQIKEPYIRSVFKAQDYFAEGGLLVVKQITNPAKVFSKAKYYFDRYINNEDEQMVFSMELDAEIIE